MKKYIIGAGIILSGFYANAQILAPVKWAYAAKRLNKNEAVILVKATIEKGWHIYSQNVADGGPVKTTLAFNKSDGYSLVNKPTEPKPLKKFENTVVFQQKVKLVKDQPVINGTVSYMACSNKECLPPEDVTFSVSVK